MVGTLEFVDPVSSIALWTTMAFLVWLALTWFVRHRRVPFAVLVTASLSWIIAKLVLDGLPALIHHVGLWFGA